MYFSSKNQPITFTRVLNSQNQNDLNRENETNLLSVKKYEIIPIKDFYDNEAKDWPYKDFIFEDNFNIDFQETEQNSESIIEYNSVNISNNLNANKKKIKFHTEEFIKKKKGQKPKKEKNKMHGSDSFDNLLTKIQVHFFSFITDISNDALKAEFGENTFTFKNLPYKFKKKTDFDTLLKNKNSILKDILKVNISPKYKKYGQNINENILKKACEKSKFLSEFFNMKYIDIFREYYDKNTEKPLNIINYKGKTIFLSPSTKSIYYLFQNNKALKNELKETINEVFYNAYIKNFGKNQFV